MWQRILRRQIDKLPAADLLRLRDGLSKLINSLAGEGLSIGTACSGTDLIAEAVAELQDMAPPCLALSNKWTVDHRRWSFSNKWAVDNRVLGLSNKWAVDHTALGLSNKWAIDHHV